MITHEYHANDFHVLIHGISIGSLTLSVNLVKEASFSSSFCMYVEVGYQYWRIPSQQSPEATSTKTTLDSDVCGACHLRCTVCHVEMEKLMETPAVLTLIHKSTHWDHTAYMTLSH